jgi:hypothetical protein
LLGAEVVVVAGGAVVVVVVVVAGGAVVVVSADATIVVVVVVAGGGSVTEVGAAVLGGGDVVVRSEAVDVTSIASGAVVEVVGAPIATGVATTRSRMPATAADAITTDNTVAASHAAPIAKYLLINPSMHHPMASWVKRRLNHAETTVIRPVLRSHAV